MQTRRLAALVAICAALSMGSARAAVSTDSFLLRSTGDLVNLCSATSNEQLYTAAVNFCHGFAVGVFRVLHAEDAAHPSHRMFCLPNPAPSRTQAIAAFVRWAEADTGRLQQSPSDGIAAFLAQQYPCSTRR